MVSNKEIKRYYKEVENYDWVEVTDNIKGIESFFHKIREFKTNRLIKKYGIGDKYLDMGCGTGLILRHLPPNSVGVDINPRNIEKAKQHVPTAQFFICDIEEKLPFKDQSFSTIICTETLEHLLYPEKALEEAKRVLKNRGVIIGSVPKKSLFWKFRFLSSTRPNEPLHRYYTRETLNNLFKKKFKNFKIIETFYSLFFIIYNS